MTTLKQILIDKFYEIGGNPCGSCLTSDEAKKFFKESAKEWLQQNQNKMPRFSKHHDWLINQIFNDLLGELEQ